MDTPDGFERSSCLLRGPFFCPTCNEPLLLKAGKIKRWHFAHKPHATCLISGEPETDDHLNGKQLLYQWLRQQLYIPSLEHYLPELAQRPDLYLFKSTSTPAFAFEYQCSDMPPDLFQQRTYGYNRHNINPLWIFSANRFTLVNRDVYRLKSLELAALALCYKNESPPYLCFFSTKRQQFQILSNIQPLTPTRFFATKVILNMKETPFSYILNAPKQSQSYDRYIATMLQIKKGWRTQQRLDKSKAFSYIWRCLSQKGKSLYAFPSYVGLSLPSAIALQDSIYLWQTWFVWHFVWQKKGETLQLKRVQLAFKQLLNNGVFRLRSGFTIQLASQALATYVEMLMVLGVLRRLSSEEFVVVVDERWRPLTLSEATSVDTQTLQRLKQCFKHHILF